eukprot:comp20009_c0_seq1/m.24516 comp20009_c0_seq1/g.24516  ORF comp20009_c0_seq1/g.24516 comp20009_c0_seq1/m.24516 type:complete len:729 (-) comp20009_c0_seq1:34-2220(-)
METQKAGSPSGCCRSSMVHLEALSGGLSGSVPEKGKCGAGDEGDCKETPTSLRRTQSESQCHKLTGHRRTLEACSTGSNPQLSTELVQSRPRISITNGTMKPHTESMAEINHNVSKYAVGSSHLLAGSRDSLKQAHTPPPTLLRRVVSSTHHKDSDDDCSRHSSTDSNSSCGSNQDLVVYSPKKGLVGTVTEAALETILPVFEVVADVGSYWLKKSSHLLFPQSIKASFLRGEMNSAVSYADWVQRAIELDRLEGKQQWKMEFSSDLYDSVLIEKKLEDLRRARRNNDVRQMMFLLRSGLFRNLGNIGNPLLYEYCNVGTKRLIEKYIDEVVYQLNQLADADWPGVTLADLVDFFRDTRQAFGRSALLLSGGGAFGPYHIGVCKALFQHNLLPRIVAGSSVGSIVAGCICCKTDSELNEMLAHPIEMNAFDELDSDYPLLRKFKRLFQEGVLADVGPLREAVIKFVGDMTFQEAYNKTRRILNITVNSANPHESARLLNFLTAPHVVIWSAICASCALPGLFKPVQLLAKDKNGKLVNWGLSGEQWTDGSVETDLPTTRLSELFNVNHFIVCQINPHVLPFMHPRSPLSALSLHYPRTAELLVQELRHRATQLAQVHNAFRPVRDVLNQKYTGHITIVPDIHFTDYPKIISSPEPEYMKRAILLGERSTWPKIGMMRIHCDIELTLDRIFFRLQQRAFDQDNSLAQQDFVPDPARIARAQQRHASCVH